jgi:diguanylate cyclase (GGDEF)-like protein
MNPTTDDTASLLAQAKTALADGHMVVAKELAEAAWSQLQGRPDSHTQRQAGVLLTSLRYRTGQLVAMQEVGLAVLPAVRNQGPSGELVDLLRMIGMGACDSAHFERALSCTQEAHQVATALGDVARRSLTLNSLGCFFERIGDPWHGERLLLEALAMAAECPDPHPRFTALNNLCAALIGAFYLLRDAVELPVAQEPLVRVLPHAQEVLALAEAHTDPFYGVVARGNFGEVLLHLGQHQAAERHLHGAHAVAVERGFTAQRWRIEASLAELVLQRGEFQAARELLDNVLQKSAGSDPRTTHLRLHHAMWRAAKALGDTALALHHLERYQRLERERALNQLRGQSQLFITRLEAEQVRLEAHHERQRAARFEQAAHHDALTRLPNRRELERRWPLLTDRLRVELEPLALAMLDVDRFKNINDAHGHAAGDAVLVALAHVLRDSLRADDLLVRMGGEEFALVLPRAGTARALEVCERLRLRVAQHGWERISPGLAVTVSIGLAHAPSYELTDLMQRADVALYRAKRGGRNRVE